MIIPLPKLQREEYPDITLRTVRSWAESGAIPGAHRVRGRWYVDLDAFNARQDAPQVSDDARAVLERLRA